MVVVAPLAEDIFTKDACFSVRFCDVLWIWKKGGSEEIYKKVKLNVK